MQIELIGCTGSGKTTLMSRICRVGREQAMEIVTKDQFVLGLIGLDRIKSPSMRTLLVDLVAAVACGAAIARHWRFYWFALRTVRSLPAGWFEKINLFRNVLKKVGVFETVHRFCPRGKMVVVDEGTLHAVHNLFVHSTYDPADADFRTFVQLVPIPEVAVWVQQPPPVLIRRAFRGRHRRLHNADARGAQLFIQHAVAAFDRLGSEPAIRNILLVADMTQRTVTCNADAETFPLLRLAAGLLRSALVGSPHAPQFEISSAEL